MNDMHTPSPEFTRFLEWQTRTTLRRSERFGAGGAAQEGATASADLAVPFSPSDRVRRGPNPSPGLARAFRIAAIILVSMMAGAAGVVAAERVRESKVVERLLSAQTIRITLAEKKLTAAVSALERGQVLVDAGHATSLSLMPLREDQVGIEEELGLLRIDSEEVRAAGREPDRALDAPVVGGRDFEGERIELSLGMRRRRLVIADERFQIAEQLVNNGLAPVTEAAGEKLAFDLLELEVERLDSRLRLRRAFVDGQHEKVAVLRLGYLLDAGTKKASLQIERAHLSTRLEIAELRYREGISPDAGDGIRVEIARIDAELELNALEHSLYEEK